MCTEKTLCVSQECIYRKQCRCWCEGQFTDPILLQRCKGACHADPNLRHRGEGNFINKYLCGSKISAADIYLKLGHLCDGFDPMTDTGQGQKALRDEEKRKENEKKEEAARKRTMMLLIVMAIVVIIFVGIVRTT